MDEARDRSQSGRNVGATALERARPFLRLPPGAALRDGVLDLLGGDFAPTFTQRSLDTRLTAFVYDALRDRLAPAIGMPDFTAEAANVAQGLALATGDVVLDVACGHGNFTVEIARRVGPEGLVIGLDISAAMLRRAVGRLRRSGLENVLLVRGDALDLPIPDGVLSKVNCSGGLHQFPDLGKALAEIARVSAPGARLTASGFAEAPDDPRARTKRWARRRLSLHFVPTRTLAQELGALGYQDVDVRMAGAFVAHAGGRLTRRGPGS